MSRFLLFQLYSPLASWGSPAVGEVRHTDIIPTRSALLGLLAAALGITREQEERLNQFDHHYHFALLPLSSQEHWLRDYHTTEVPKENKKRTYFTRREELTLAPDEVSTLLSMREYRCDAYYMIAVSATEEAPVSLETLAEALITPIFPLYLGRKACPLALPLNPQVREGNLAQVFRAAENSLAPELIYLYANRPLTMMCFWEGEQEGIERIATQQRSDQPLSRRRWQFGSRLQFSGTYGRET